jgi:hypothetical protein
MNQWMTHKEARERMGDGGWWYNFRRWIVLTWDKLTGRKEDE